MDLYAKFSPSRPSRLRPTEGGPRVGVPTAGSGRCKRPGVPIFQHPIFSQTILQRIVVKGRVVGNLSHRGWSIDVLFEHTYGLCCRYYRVRKKSVPGGIRHRSSSICAGGHFCYVMMRSELMCYVNRILSVSTKPRIQFFFKSTQNSILLDEDAWVDRSG